MEHGITVLAGPAITQLGAAVCDTLQLSAGVYGTRPRSRQLARAYANHNDHDESPADLRASA
jgi:hypothetical protein